MEPQTIAALVGAERSTERHGTAHDPHHQRRLDALRARDRQVAALARAGWRHRIRTRLARGIRHLAELVEPPRPVRVSPVSDQC